MKFGILGQCLGLWTTISHSCCAGIPVPLLSALLYPHSTVLLMVTTAKGGWSHTDITPLQKELQAFIRAPSGGKAGEMILPRHVCLNVTE